MPVSSLDVLYQTDRVVSNQVIKNVLIASMGGLILGYDIALTGGLVVDQPFLSAFFPSSLRPGADGNGYCGPDAPILTLFASSTYLLASVAALFASGVTTIFGRKSSMTIGGMAYFVGSLVAFFADNTAMLVASRVFAGIGVGFAIQSTPLYISEIAPTIYRGAFNFFLQMAMTIGIVLGFTNVFLYNWRIAICIGVVPGAILFYGTNHITDTPISLLQQDCLDEASRALDKLRVYGSGGYTEFDLLCNARKPADCPWQEFMLQRRYRPQLVLCVLVPLFHQLVGVNAVRFCAFYATLVFTRMGYGKWAQVVSLLTNGLVGWLVTIIAIYSVDRIGRRRLLLNGGILMTTFLLFMAIAIGIIFGVSGVGSMNYACLTLLLCLIWGYIAGFAVSLGPLAGWLVTGELCPREIRSEGQSLSVIVSMISAFVAAQGFAPALCHVKFGVFILLAASGILMTVLAYLFFPEARHVHIEDMGAVWRDHWYWKRFVDTGDTAPAAARR